MRWVALCLLVTTVIGCGRGGLQRVIVSGRVTYQGEAIANGEIRFVPTKGTQGPVSGGTIIEGVYTADGLGGVGGTERYVPASRLYTTGLTSELSSPRDCRCLMMVVGRDRSPMASR